MVLGYRLIVVIYCVIFSVIAYTDAVEDESAEAVKLAKPTPAQAAWQDKKAYDVKEPSFMLQSTIKCITRNKTL